MWCPNRPAAAYCWRWYCQGRLRRRYSVPSNKARRPRCRRHRRRRGELGTAAVLNGDGGPIGGGADLLRRGIFRRVAEAELAVIVPPPAIKRAAHAAALDGASVKLALANRDPCGGIIGNARHLHRRFVLSAVADAVFAVIVMAPGIQHVGRIHGAGIVAAVADGAPVGGHADLHWRCVRRRAANPDFAVGVMPPAIQRATDDAAGVAIGGAVILDGNGGPARRRDGGADGLRRCKIRGVAKAEFVLMVISPGNKVRRPRCRRCHTRLG